MYNYVRKLYMFIRQHLLCSTFAVFIHFFNTKHLKNTAATMVYSSLNSACSFTLSPQPTTAHTVGDKSMTNDKFCMDSLFVFLQWPCIYPRLFPWHQNNTDILFAGSHCARVPVVWVCHSHIVICLHIFFFGSFLTMCFLFYIYHCTFVAGIHWQITHLAPKILCTRRMRQFQRGSPGWEMSLRSLVCEDLWKEFLLYMNTAYHMYYYCNWGLHSLSCECFWYELRFQTALVIPPNCIK